MKLAYVYRQKRETSRRFLKAVSALKSIANGLRHHTLTQDSGSSARVAVDVQTRVANAIRAVIRLDGTVATLMAELEGMMY